ncbi:unnamed protein product [Rotaria sp. Silwood2]|nr:unnamed protein product [Rotaria sp. Silwood2]CAF4783076.1 unnamed protein product [Rotaria sp. Silwood2]
MHLNVSKSTINRIANKVEKQRQLSLLNKQKPKFYRRRQIAISDIARHITSYNVSQENGPTISIIVNRCGISVDTTIDVIHAKSRKKKG